MPTSLTDNSSKFSNTLKYLFSLRNGETIARRDLRFIRQNRRDLLFATPIVLIMKIPILGKLVLLTIVVKFPWILPSTFKFLKPEGNTFIYFCI